MKLKNEDHPVISDEIHTPRYRKQTVFVDGWEIEEIFDSSQSLEDAFSQAVKAHM